MSTSADDPKAACEHNGVSDPTSSFHRCMEGHDPKAAPSLADDAERIYITRLEWRRAVAALRAVEAVRAFSVDPPRGYVGGADYHRGYRDGVKAVQALMEGER